MHKANHIITIVVDVLVSLAGLAAVVFGIMNLAGVTTVNSIDIMCLLIAGVIGIAGIYKAILAFVFGKNDLEIEDIITSFTLIGISAFFFSAFSNNSLYDIVSKGIPFVSATIGAGILIKGIVALCRKQEQQPSILLISSGVIGIAFGLLFLLVEPAAKVLWLIMGLFILGGGLVQLFRTIKFKE